MGIAEFRRVAFGVTVLLLLSSCSGGGAGPTGGAVTLPPNCDFQRGGSCYVNVGGGQIRRFILHVPGSYQPNVSALVVGLHGSGGSGAQMEAGSGLSAKADEAGFVMVYPDARPAFDGRPQWSNFFSDVAFDDHPPDDVGFLRDLINTLQDHLHPDPKRIYFTGVSNGGLMTYRVGMELSDLVAAIGIVEGTLYGFGGTLQGLPRARAPVSVLILHGDQDPVIPYCATQAFGSASQETTFDYWAGPSGNDCSRLDPPTPLCDAAGEITSVSQRTATGCGGHTEVKFYKLIGGAHRWYLTPMNLPDQVPYNAGFDSATGVTTPDILWSFFDTHPMP